MSTPVLTSRRRYWLKKLICGSSVNCSPIRDALECCWLLYRWTLLRVWSIFIADPLYCFRVEARTCSFCERYTYIHAASELSRNIPPCRRHRRFAWHLFFFLSMHISEYRSDLVISSQSADTLLWTASSFNLSSALLIKAAARDSKGYIFLCKAAIFSMHCLSSRGKNTNCTTKLLSRALFLEQ